MMFPERVALGTMHGKEAAMAPALARIGIEVVVPAGLDTDFFGTFTGEVPRRGTMEQAARAKAEAAIAATGLAVGIASEGAYGPHPAMPFLPLGRELILWRNGATGQEIAEWLNDDEPAFGHCEAAVPEEAEHFLSRIGFPSTAITVQPAGARGVPVAKGIRDLPALDLAVTEAARQSPEARALLQADMRAHMNARRMSVIARLADRLVLRLATPCPVCAAPGFGASGMVAGLRCSDCGTATALAKSITHSCSACGFERAQPRPDGRVLASPAECPECNP